MKKLKCTLHDVRSASCKKGHFGFFHSYLNETEKNQLLILIIIFRSIFVQNEVFYMLL